MELTASQLAAIVNGTVEGDENVKVSTFARIEEGHSGALSFLANPKYTHHIYSTDSSVVLVKKDFTPEQPVKATLIRVDDPYATVAHLLEMVTQMSKVEKVGIETPSFISEGVDVPEDAYVGAFAYIGKGVKLAPGVKIYPQVYIGDGCEVGEGTVLYAGVKIYAGCKVGNVASSIRVRSSALTDSVSHRSTGGMKKFPRLAMSKSRMMLKSEQTPP